MDEDRWLPRSVRPPGLVRPAPLDPTGRRGPTRGQAAGPRYRQTSAGLYVPAAVDGGVVEQRIVEQASRIRSYGAVTAWAALRWWRDPVEWSTLYESSSWVVLHRFS